MVAEQRWQEELEQIKSILKKTGLVETVKWGTPVYTHNGKNVVGLAPFKDFLSVWFYNGVFLKDEHHVLINASEGKTKALRQWRFRSGAEINEDLLLKYIKEAIHNEEEGRVWKAEKSAVPATPEILLNSLNADPNLKAAFEKLSPYKQKDYIEHLNIAKREDTKSARLEKMIPLILQGVGLNDKYKNC